MEFALMLLFGLAIEFMQAHWLLFVSLGALSIVVGWYADDGWGGFLKGLALAVVMPFLISFGYAAITLLSWHP